MTKYKIREERFHDRSVFYPMKKEGKEYVKMSYAGPGGFGEYSYTARIDMPLKRLLGRTFDDEKARCIKKCKKIISLDKWDCDHDPLMIVEHRV